jgi:hypothetical protein
LALKVFFFALADLLVSKFPSSIALIPNKLHVASCYPTDTIIS